MKDKTKKEDKERNLVYQPPKKKKGPVAWITAKQVG